MTSPHLRRLAGNVERTTARVVTEAQARGIIRSKSDLAGVRLPWYEIRNAAGGDGRHDGPAGGASVFIYDEIGGSLGVSAKQFVADLEAITAPTINLRVNSPGGGVFEAITIHSALMHHPAKVRAYVDGIAASAASVIIQAADPYDADADTGGIFMMPGTEQMIHDASNMLEGNSEEHMQDSLHLARQSDNIAGMYARRAGKTADEWRDLMLAETWVFADEAVEMGLADKVVGSRAAYESYDDEADATLLTRSFDMSTRGYKYESRSAAPAPGTAGRQRRDFARGGLVTQDGRRAAAEARKRSFESGATATMPDGSQRAQTRSGVLGHGSGRSRLPFAAQLRGVPEPRNGKDMFHVHGYASVFDKPYQMWDTFGEYEEVVVRGAADRTLASDPDVSFLLNHGGVTMARTTNGTLSLSADNVGLIQDAWLNTTRSDVQILMSAIEDELITEMSFAFMIPDDGAKWSDDFATFEIRRFDIDRGDVSAVNYGASPWTSIAARAREVLMHTADLPEGMRREFAARMGGVVSRFERRAAADMPAEVDTTPLTADVIPVRAAVPRKQGRTLSTVENMLRND